MTNKIKRKRKRKRKRKKIYFGHIVQSQLLIKLTNHMGSCFSLSIKNLLSFSLDQPSHLCHWYFDRPVHLSSASIQAALTNPWCSLSLSLSLTHTHTHTHTHTLSLSTYLISATLTSLMHLIFFVMGSRFDQKVIIIISFFSFQPYHWLYILLRHHWPQNKHIFLITFIINFIIHYELFYGYYLFKT